MGEKEISNLLKKVEVITMLHLKERNSSEYLTKAEPLNLAKLLAMLMSVTCLSSILVQRSSVGLDPVPLTKKEARACDLQKNTCKRTTDQIISQSLVFTKGERMRFSSPILINFTLINCLINKKISII